jgi:exodeoxyribonuclease-3
MTLKIASWNVNSVRLRIGNLAALVEEQAPDVLCLQETKAMNDVFPVEAFESLGYGHQGLNGIKGYNGVAIVSRLPFADKGALEWCGRADGRHAFATLENGVEINNFYVPAGGDVPDADVNDKFAHKLRFLREMAEWAERTRLGARAAILVGDLNVAPLETDVWNHKRLLRSVGHTPVESDHIARLIEAGGLIDVGRHFVPASEPLYTWWGYRYPRAFDNNYGWRLDHILATAPLKASLAGFRVVRDTRAWERPSDHVPVVLDIG